MQIKTVGIVLETKEDAIRMDRNMAHLYHWRVDKEIAAITDALRNRGYEVELIGTPQDYLDKHNQLKDTIDFIFNLSVGFLNRFRLAQGPMLYETAGIPYSGADPYTKMTTQNKHIFKSFMDKMGYNTPEWHYIHHPEQLQGVSISQYPLFIKPAYEGSSIGINEGSKVDTYEVLNDRVEKLYDELSMPLLIESFIAGHEYKVGILGNGSDKELYMIEDIKSDGSHMAEDFLYFDAKTAGSYDKISRDIHSDKYEELKKMCLEVYELFEPLDYGTFDIRADDNGNFYIIEFNADATLHPDRTLAKCCELNGVSYESLIGKIMTSALKRWGCA